MQLLMVVMLKAAQYLEQKCYNNFIMLILDQKRLLEAYTHVYMHACAHEHMLI